MGGLDSGDKRYNVTRSATGSECAHVEFEFGIPRNCRRGNPAAAGPNRARRPQHPTTTANWAHAPTRRATTVQSGGRASQFSLDVVFFSIRLFEAALVIAMDS